VEPAGVVAARRRAAVLLVEPDDLLADLVASVLREDGFRVAVAAGLAAAESSARGAGILLLASSAAQRDRVRALRLTARFPRVLLLGEPLPGFGGADDALAKPFRPDQLVRVVAELGERG
jgi:DNA-binding response OmpR family regulator